MNISLVDFLAQMGRAVAHAKIEAVRHYSEILLAQDTLDMIVPLADEKIPVDGAALLPKGLPQLDTLEIECETEISSVEAPRSGDDQEKVPIPDLQMSLTKGLFRRGFHVKIKAVYTTSGPVEALEMLRNHAEEKLRDALGETNQSGE